MSEPQRVWCPLCQSGRVLVLLEMDAKVLICECRECRAQFSVSPDPDRRLTGPPDEHR
jgi:hypothetical protein